MVYGEEKARDMARSLLPSRHREVARKERARIHRESRRTARLEVAQFERDPEAFDGEPGPAEGTDQQISLMAWRRRQGDKVQPFIRWATATTRELPRESRLSHIQGLIPKGVIGEHALDHLERTKAFRDLREREWWLIRWSNRQHREWMDRGEKAQLLRAVLSTPGGHRAFNGWLRARRAIWYDHSGRPTYDGPIRMLLGTHDVLPFLTETHGPAAQEFLRAFKEQRGHVEATLAALGMRDGRWRPAGVRSLQANVGAKT